MQKKFLFYGFIFICALGLFSLIYREAGLLFFLAVALYIVGIHDIFQKKHAILRTYPVIGHVRYLLELIRPEIQQYFIEGYSDGKPFSREQRAVVYQRAKVDVDTTPFGTQLDLYAVGAEWIDHSISPKPKMTSEPRVLIGNEQCSKPYSASLFNISAMSFGSISKNAVAALNRGAKLGGFIQDTGEGSLTKYHLMYGGDITWQVATGYFGCRTLEGKFDRSKFQEKAILENVKMIEIKLSQGAKPGHGGILPAAKITPEIAEIRGIPMGVDCISPAAHTAFTTPSGMMAFVSELRKLSGGKPIGFKLCVGKRHEFLAICKAMMKTGVVVDFITVDGAEGGTGAAPLEFTNWMGTPLNEGLNFVHNSLVGCGLRKKIKIIASGKVITGFDIAAKLAMGADLCNTARGMMFAVGCIQALRCNTNQCPTGVATQDPDLVRGLDVIDKSVRVSNYHRLTISSFLDVLAAAGLSNPSELHPHLVQRRINDTEVLHYDQIYHYLREGELLSGPVPERFKGAWERANPETFN
jgi:glutamate synthase domain-containing protein 2